MAPYDIFEALRTSHSLDVGSKPPFLDRSMCTIKCEGQRAQRWWDLIHISLRLPSDCSGVSPLDLSSDLDIVQSSVLKMSHSLACYISDGALVNLIGATLLVCIDVDDGLNRKIWVELYPWTQGRHRRVFSGTV